MQALQGMEQGRRAMGEKEGVDHLRWHQYVPSPLAPPAVLYACYCLMHKNPRRINPLPPPLPLPRTKQDISSSRSRTTPRRCLKRSAYRYAPPPAEAEVCGRMRLE